MYVHSAPLSIRWRLRESRSSPPIVEKTTYKNQIYSLIPGRRGDSDVQTPCEILYLI